MENQETAGSILLTTVNTHFMRKESQIQLNGSVSVQNFRLHVEQEVYGFIRVFFRERQTRISVKRIIIRNGDWCNDPLTEYEGGWEAEPVIVRLDFRAVISWRRNFDEALVPMNYDDWMQIRQTAVEIFARPGGHWDGNLVYPLVPGPLPPELE